MAATTRSRHSAAPRRRSHAQRQPFDRRELERRGWRTTLDYRENHERDADGVLGTVTTQWRAEGEWSDADGEVIAMFATGASPAAAWRRLRSAAEAARPSGRSREAARP